MRKIRLTACLAGLLIAAAAPTFASEETEKNKAVARRVFDEVLSQGRFEVSDLYYASDFQVHGSKGTVGHAEDMEAARQWRLAFPDAVMTVDRLVAEGDTVAVLWTGRGTNTGKGAGLPATGKKIQLTGTTIWRFRDGKIVEEWSTFNEYGLLEQLGLVPAGAMP